MASSWPCCFPQENSVLLPNESFINQTGSFKIAGFHYSPKWRWLAVDIYRAAKWRGKYPTLATDTEVNSCFSIY